MAAHDFELDEVYKYGCKICGSRYHCAECNDSSGMYGHYVSDDDGGFFHCQEPDRHTRMIDNYLKRIRSKSR